MFRTVLIRKSSKLQYLQGYLVIFDGEDEKKVFLDDISVLLIESTSTLITVPLMIQLIKNNIAVLLCDEKHNPVGTLLGINNHYNLSGNLYKQLNWKDNITADLWVEIVRMKIQNQLKVLKIFEKSNQELLEQYLTEVEPNDKTNREGLAAKVYFFSLFGQGFNRNEETVINGLLNYGYSILLSCFNREIASSGYLTQLGIFHKGKTNPFNLSSDFMEPFRPMVDIMAYLNLNNKDPIKSMRKLATRKIIINDEERYLDDSIGVYVKSLIRYLNEASKVIPKIDYMTMEHYKDVEINETNSDV